MWLCWAWASGVGLEDLYISGLRAECPPHCAWLPHGSSPSVTLSPAVRPGGSGSCAGWSRCRAKDGCLRPPAASTQLLLRAEAWCCRSCTAEPGLKDEHILVPHSPMCLRAQAHMWEKILLSLTIGPHCFHQDRPLNVCFFNLTVYVFTFGWTFVAVRRLSPVGASGLPVTVPSRCRV